MQIDHDPNERRVTNGETIFVTIVTFVVLTALGSSARFVFDEYGTLYGLSFCAIGLIIAFLIAFWLEAKKKRYRD